VIIKGGPFMGLEGVIWSLKSTTKVRLNVEVIGQAASLEVAREYIDIID